MNNAFDVMVNRYPRAGRLVLAGGLLVLVTAAFVSPAAAKRPVKAICGNGIAEEGEACDTGDLRGSTCESLGFAGGSLACTGACTLDTGGCTNVSPRFIDNGDGTATDTQTGLQWEKKDGDDGVPNLLDPHDVDNLYTWGDFAGCTFIGCPNGTAFTDFLGRLNYCVSTDGSQVTSAGFAGHCDWRIPTIQELETIRDLEAPGCGGANGCVDPILGPSATTVWSSSTPGGQDGAGYAWYAVFINTNKYAYPKTWGPGGHYRAVRGGF